MTAAQDALDAASLKRAAELGMVWPTPVPDPAPTPTPSGVPYFTTSGFWVPVAASPTIDPKSASWAASLSGSGQRVLNTRSYSNPIYTADASTPRFKLTVTQQGSWGDNALTHTTVPIPASVVPSPGSDGKLVIIDPSTGNVFDLWQAKKTATGWQCTWGAVYPIVGDGAHQTGAGSGTGSGLSTLLGTIRISEIAAGQINHALAFSSDLAASLFRSPATKSDGSSSGGLPEGARVQLDPAASLSVSGITPIEKMIGKALQTFGAYLVDTGGARIAFACEMPQTATDSQVLTQAGAAADYTALPHIPWAKLRVLA